MQILVASSDRAIRTRLRTLCEASGTDVIEASSIGEAVEAALIWPVAGAVVDLTRDNLLGHRTVELIHQCRPSLPLVVVAEGGPAESVTQWVIGSLPEPYGPAEVERVLRSIRTRNGRTRSPKLETADPLLEGAR